MLAACHVHEVLIEILNENTFTRQHKAMIEQVYFKPTYI